MNLDTATPCGLILINPFAQMLTGWKQKEALGKPLDIVFKVVDEETGKKVDDPITKAKRDGIFYGLALNNILVGKDGRKIPVDIISSLIKDGVIGIAITFYDIIDRKRSGELNFFNKPFEKRKYDESPVDHNFRDNISLFKLSYPIP